MARRKCDFVKGAQAAWYCGHCDTHFSEQCIPDGYNPQWGKQGPTCIKCHTPLQDLNDPSAHLPFWQVVPYLLIYPLHFNALLLILMGAGGVYLVGGGIPGYLYSVVFSILSVKYWLAVITRRAEGERWAPSLIELARPDPHRLFLQLIGVYVLFAAAILAADVWGSVWLELGLAAFTALALPASIMILATEKNLLKAVSPLRLFGVMADIGIGPYLAMWLMTAVLTALSAGLTHWLEPRLSDAWRLPVLVAVGIYFSLVLHALLGYVLFQYRDVLGDVSVSHKEPKLEGEAFRKAKLLGEIRVFEQMGDDKRLRAPMRDLLDVCRDDLDAHRRYQALLMRLNNDQEALAKHTDYLLGLLLAARKHGEALTLVKDVCAIFPGYRLRNADTALHLARLLVRKKEFRAAVAGNGQFAQAGGEKPGGGRSVSVAGRGLGRPLAGAGQGQSGGDLCVENLSLGGRQ